jgi:hypothetical protein
LFCAIVARERSSAASFISAKSAGPPSARGITQRQNALYQVMNSATYKQVASVLILLAVLAAGLALTTATGGTRLAPGAAAQFQEPTRTAPTATIG